MEPYLYREDRQPEQNNQINREIFLVFVKIFANPANLFTKTVFLLVRLFFGIFSAERLGLRK